MPAKPSSSNRSADRSGAGDPARTLELLWRQPGHGQSTHGPRQRHSIDEVVDAAIAIADEGGIETVTMRAVAARIGIAPMSIYTYVPGKAELLDLMLDRLYLAMARPPLADLPWRDRLTSVAEHNRALFRAHPWVAAVATIRPTLGPGTMAKYEHELSAFTGLGLDDVTTDDALTYLLTFVQAGARAANESTDQAIDSAMTDQQWWAANEPLLSRVFDPTAYPLAARIGTASAEANGSAYAPDHAYEFGLARTLDALAALIEK
ncbi:MAG TPA: TetR/AcrR family transcriptional regulator [Pseudonocardiaceae bacterium]|jgi:AcrR family transcriptional regulator